MPVSFEFAFCISKNDFTNVTFSSLKTISLVCMCISRPMEGTMGSLSLSHEIWGLGMPVATHIKVALVLASISVLLEMFTIDTV